jgi:hypothetical protein
MHELLNLMNTLPVHLFLRPLNYPTAFWQISATYSIITVTTLQTNTNTISEFVLRVLACERNVGSVRIVFQLLENLPNSIRNTAKRYILQNMWSSYRLKLQLIEVRSRAEAKDCSSNLCVQTGSETHPASYTMGTEVLSPGLKHGRDMTLITHPHIVARSRMSRSYTSSPISAFVARSGTALALTWLWT